MDRLAFVILSTLLMISPLGASSTSRTLYITASDNQLDFSDQNTPYYNPKNDIVLGKDRELFSISIDIKWLISKISDPSFWIDAFRQLSVRFNPFSQHNELDITSRNNSMRILSGIRKLSKGSIVKIFRGNLQQAQAYSILKSRFIVLYVEDTSDWNQNLICRKTLADNSVGNAINDNFVLFAGSAQHSVTVKFAKTLGAKDFPYLAILHVPIPTRNSNILKSSPEVLGTLNLGKDLRPDKVLRFLSKALEFHSKTLVEDKRVIDSHELLQQTLIEILEQTEVSQFKLIKKDKTLNSMDNSKKSSVSATGTVSQFGMKKKVDIVVDTNSLQTSPSSNSAPSAASSSINNIT